MTEQFSIQDVATMIASVQYIEQTVTDNKKLLTALNGRQDKTEKDVAVLEKGAAEHEKQHGIDRETHEKEHDKLDSRIKAVGIGNAGFALVGAFFATLLGRQT